MAEDKVDTEKVLKQIGKRLRDLRKENGFSNYEHFAYEHGFNRASYGGYENGNNMRLSTLIQLLHAHGITLEEFFSKS